MLWEGPPSSGFCADTGRVSVSAPRAVDSSHALLTRSAFIRVELDSPRCGGRGGASH